MSVEDLMKLKYTQLQIIKHALQYYIERPNAQPTDLVREKKLLDRVMTEIVEMKTKYEI